MNLCKEGYTNQDDVKVIGSIILVVWEVYPSGGCTDEIIGVLVVVEKGVSGFVCGTIVPLEMFEVKSVR